MASSYFFAALILGLLCLLSTLPPSLGKTACTTCEIYAGQGQGALNLGALNDTSLILSRTTSRAIQSSSTPLSFTIEAWFLIPDTGLRRPQPLFARYPRTAPILGDSHAEFVLQLQSSGNLNLFFGGGSDNPNVVGLELDCGFTTIPSGEWSHVALTVDTMTGRTNPHRVWIYVNGQSACGWDASLPDAQAFDGTRQVMHDQPFAVGDYESPATGSVCGSTLETLAGTIDEVRVWAGARSEASIQAWYDTVVSPAIAGPTLVAQFSMDSENALDANGGDLVVDSSATGADAWVSDSAPSLQWIASTAPIVARVWPANFKLTPVYFYGWSVDPSDGWYAIVHTTDSDENILYKDSQGQIPLADGSNVLTAPGADYPMAYFYSTAQVNAIAVINYTVAAVNPSGQVVEFNSAEIIVDVVAHGCDGYGGQFDRCGVCNGNGRCAPYGCDGLGGVEDECGVCNGNNDTCECAITTWRGLSTLQLDIAVTSSDLAEMDSVLQTTDDALVTLTTMLLAGDEDLTCDEYTRVLAAVETMRANTQSYNDNVLTPFLNGL